MESTQTDAKLELDFLNGGGEMGALIRAYDWTTTPLGPPKLWPQSLKTSIAIMLRSGYPIFVWWGPQMIMFHNDAYLPVLGKKHPYALGKPATIIWSEIWDQIGPMMDKVLNNGEQIYAQDLLFLLGRKGFSEECYFTFSYSPIPNEYGGVGGIFCASNEETQKVLRQRRLKTLKDISELTAQLRSVDQVYNASVKIIAENPHDIPFSLLYILNDDLTEAKLEGHTGFGPEKHEALKGTVLFTNEHSTWPFIEVIRTGRGMHVDSLAGKFGDFPGGPWMDAPQQAIVVPIQRSGQDRLAGFFVSGISPKLEFDHEYHSYLDLVAGQISTAIANVRAFEEERKRAEALAALDKAKTVFFSNISHEFRTPLTLMLGPLEEVLNRASIQGEDKKQLSIVHRNGLRLLKLVNTLLDFSRIEAGKIQARFQPADISSITMELSSVFRSAVEKAGIVFSVNCKAAISQPVFLDPVMWERIIFNLLSNAYKFTLKGEISVTVTEENNHAIVKVKDTGTGIPGSELPKLFTRFHRIEGSTGRTHEGSGIGLAMVYELVKLHGGEIKVDSVEGSGTEFTIYLRFGQAHLSPETISNDAPTPIASLNTMPFAEEELNSFANSSANLNYLHDDRPLKNYKLLIADDNSDMRDYLSNLLSKYYDVVACVDGQDAYKAATSAHFDLVLSDIMMPRLDGMGLLSKIRNDERTKSLPVIFLSARAGEEAKVEGIEAGADDYLVKPFSSKELLARVKTHLEMSRVRKEALVREINLTEELKLSRQRIQSAYETLHNLIMQVPALVCILKGPEHEYELVNPAYQKLFGSRKLTGKKIKEALPELAGQGIFELLDTVYTTGKSHVAKELPALLAKDENAMPQECYFNLLYQPMHDDNKHIRGIFVFAYEVTDQVLARKAAQNIAEDLEQKVLERTTELVQKNDELKQQKEFIEVILDSSIDLIGVYDNETRLITFNKKCEQVFRVRREEVVGKKLLEIFPGSEKSNAYQDLLKALSGITVHNEKFKDSVSCRYYENFLIPLKNYRNETTAALVIAHDIHDIVESAERLKQSNDELLKINDELKQRKEFIETLFDASVDLIIVFDRNLKFVSVNKKVEDRYGLRLSNITGNHVLDIFPHLKDTEVYTGLQKALKGETFHIQLYNSLVTGRSTEIFFIPIRNDQGVHQVMLIAHDNTDITNAANKLKEINEELRRKNDELEQFAFVSSHDLQEPLRKIQTFSELVAKHISNSSTAEKYLDKINASAARMSALIKDVLDYSRLSRVNDGFIETDLNEVLENVKADFELLIARSKATITYQKLPIIKGIPLQLNQLFSNLIGNSLKFTNKEPFICISHKKLSPCEIKNIRALNPATEYIQLEIKDNGIGFEQEYAEQIFTMFQRLNNGMEYGGTGIGLAMCKKIVENHRGIIKAASALHKGATFTIYLPSS